MQDFNESFENMFDTETSLRFVRRQINTIIVS